ncbi:MAG: HAD family hydrolase [Pseudomonadota bacterium]
MTHTILPHELPAALERAPESVKVLSLDCFDTLLWRDCHAPADIFAGLQHCSPGQRMAGESNARKAESTLRGRSEVHLPAIYDHAMPGADAAAKAEAIALELEAEARACFAFEPTVDLMRAAREAGLKVVIVSDTYLDAEQLRALIAASAGEEVAALIDRIFVSSTAGMSKGQGLLGKMLKAMKCAGSEVLHIGDNHHADYESARALGIPALHLAQFSAEVRQRLRFERVCQEIAGERGGTQPRALMPHRALLARDEPVMDDPALALGHSVLGPVLYAYDRWLRERAEALRAERGGKVHWLFMLRDGHLPHRVHIAGGTADNIARVEISRYTATAASLTTREAYEKHVALEHGLNPSTLARQMLFTESEIEEVVGDPQSDEEKSEAATRLLKELRTGKRQKTTRSRARGFAERLVAHVRAEVDPQPGDTLMLVDLGYNGSAQNAVDRLLSEAFDVHVAGRYLLLREMTASGFDKQGLIDSRHFDPEFLEAMCANVAVLEQLATCSLGSVMDYTEDGDPIRKASSVKGRQSEVRERVQAGVCTFASAALAPPVIRASDEYAVQGWRAITASALARFMFLPQPAELEVVKSFEHDVNLGSERMVALFDTDHAREAMRRRGLFYMKESSRMFLPAELAQESMSTRLSLLVQNRFGLGLTYDDQSPRALDIPAIYLSARDSSRGAASASPTHDGYFVARLPESSAGQGVALQLGRVFEWVEIASITRTPLRSLADHSMNDEAPDVAAAQFDAMEEHALGIYECTSENALVLITPSVSNTKAEPQMIEVVLRPLRMRNTDAAIAAHTASPAIAA